jgi:ligand-binding SRPBCC domain-containing protein
LSAFISGSAIGVYGEAGNTVLTESSPFAQDFLGTLCHEWELEAKKAPGRVALIRTGVVLSTQGGALGQMIPLFEQGLGSKLAGGRQWMSWIHIDDLVEVFVRAIEDSDFEGAFNGVSPFPVSNAEFTKLLAEYLKVGTFLPVPKLALDLALGEMAQILICSQRVSPQALESKGFHFQFPSLSAALGHLFNWKESRHDRIFEASQWVPQPRNVVFPFFSDAMNLEVLTPPFLNFRVLKTSTKTIQSGMEIDYKLKIHGVPVKWRSKICDWDPENRFRDVQLKGPYQKWDHTHTFEDLAGGTLLNDKVIYRLPWAGWGGNLTSPLVKRDIMQIFSYRMKKIRELFFGT